MTTMDAAPRPRPPKQEQEPASEEVIEVAPGVIRMQLPIWMPGLGHVNTYGLLDDRGLAVVDPGLPGPSSWKALKQRLKTAGFTVKDIHTVVVTHSHPDHFGGAGRIKREAGANLVTHRAFTTWSLEESNRRNHLPTEEEALEAERIAAAGRGGARHRRRGDPDDRGSHRRLRRRSAARRTRRREMQANSVPWGGETPWGGSKHPMPNLTRRMKIRAMRMLFRPPNPSQRVVHGERSQLAGREWVSIHTPGHTIDHLCLYDPEHGAPALGRPRAAVDHTAHLGGGQRRRRAQVVPADARPRRRARRRAASGCPPTATRSTTCPGASTRSRSTTRSACSCCSTRPTAIGPASVQDLAHEIFPKKHWGVMAESETFAHLEHMVLAGEVDRTQDPTGRFLYRAA